MPSVSEPATLAEAAATLTRAGHEGKRVGIEKDGGDVVLSTRRLDAILEHEPGDLTAIVEAGVRLSTLAERLAPYGQMLALDPPGDPTIGACLAANLSGPRRHRYGAARDLVIGVTVVLADGTIASSGGKVVKNVAGYDLGKLFSGSRGELGLVARVCVRLHPRPTAARTVVVDATEADEAQRLVQAVLRSQLVPSAVDLLWPGRLLLLFEGSDRAVDRQVETAAALVGGTVADAAVWEEVAARQQSLPTRIAFPPGELARVLGRLPEAVVRAGCGSAYVAGPPEPPQAPALRERIRAELDPEGVLV